VVGYAATAFDEAVVSTPPFEAVVHTASPYHFKSQDNKKELLEPGMCIAPVGGGVRGQLQQPWDSKVYSSCI
jgi:hypothetical protein